MLAAGGYSENRNRLVLVRLARQQGESIKEWRLPFDPGVRNNVGFIDGRGDQLHLVLAGNWHRWKITDFLDGS